MHRAPDSDASPASPLVAALAVAALLGALAGVALAWEPPVGRRPAERTRPAVAHGATVARA